MFIAALFIIPRTWKIPKCPSEKWIKKMWYVYINTMEYYSAIKMNKVYRNVDGPRDYHIE